MLVNAFSRPPAAAMLLGKLARRHRLGAFEHHVLQHMRDAGGAADLVHAAGFVPDLLHHHRRAVIFLDDRLSARWPACVRTLPPAQALCDNPRQQACDAQLKSCNFTDYPSQQWLFRHKMRRACMPISCSGDYAGFITCLTRLSRCMFSFLKKNPVRTSGDSPRLVHAPEDRAWRAPATSCPACSAAAAR